MLVRRGGNRRLERRLTLLAVLSAFALLIPAGVLGAPKVKSPPVDIQFLSLSDWHGQLDPLSIFGVGNVGGAAVISSYWQADRAANPNTLSLTGGDDFGASPPLSNFFDEETAVLAQRMMGIQVGTFGNHNFDRGIDHLQDMIDLAGAPAGAQPGTPYSYVSANLENRDAELAGVEDFKIFTVGGIKVGVVGITNPEAPTLVFPGSFGTIEPSNPYPAANKARVAAKKAGAQVVVAVIHAGVRGFDSAGQPFGELIDFANNVGGFDVIFGDHTDIQYAGVHNDQLVIEAKSKGASYASTTLSVDPSTGRVLDRDAQFVVPLANVVTPDPAVVAMLAPYRTALAAVFDGVIGVATGLFPRSGNNERLREAAIGNLTTDALRATYDTQIAFTNGGGLRSPLPSSYLPLDTTLRRTTPGYAAGPPFDLVVGDVFTLLPFGNQSLTRTVTGTQIWAMLEKSVEALPSSNGRFLQISGFKYTYDLSQPVGSRVVSVMLNDNTPILPDSTTYTAATNDFINAGGDGYTMLADGTGTTRNIMANDVLDYIRAAGTVSPTIEGRIVNVTPTP